MLRKLFAILFTSAVLAASICGCTDSLANSTPVSSTNRITSNISGSTVTTQENTSALRPSSAPSDSVSTGKKNALKSAEQYLNVMAFSYSGLIEQLEYEGYSHEQAVYGAEQAYSSASDTAAAANSSSSGSATVGEQNALQSALQYLNSMPFSYTGLIGQLEYEGYSDSEAKYAADNCGANWNEQAVKSAEQYLATMSFSRQSLIEQLEYEGFTYEQASYAATENGY